MVYWTPFQHGRGILDDSTKGESAWPWKDSTQRHHELQNSYAGVGGGVTIDRIPRPLSIAGLQKKITAWQVGKSDFAIRGVVEYDHITTMLAMTILVHFWVVH